MDAKVDPAPDEGAERSSQAGDIAALAPGWAVKAAALTMGATGLLVLVAALQLFIGVTFVSAALNLVPFAHVALGAASIFLGIKAYEMRRWAAVAGVAVSSAIAVGGAIWFVFAVSGGILSLMAMMVPFAAVGGAVFAGLSVRPCARAEAARARMFDGMPVLY